MALQPTKLLVAATGTTPGDAQPVNEYLEAWGWVATTSSNFDTSSQLDVVIEWSESSSGPWATLASTHFNSGESSKTVSDFLGMRFIGWVRAKLALAPTAGSVSVNFYVRT